MEATEILFEIDTERDEDLLEISSRDDIEDPTKSSDYLDLPEYYVDEQAEVKKVTEQPIKQRHRPNIDEIMKKSVIGPDFELLHSVPLPTTSKRALKIQRKREREKTKGPGWFNLPVQEVTEEIKNDLDLLRMRSVLDPKRVYKNNDISHTPKYFQVGTVVEAPADYYNSRIPKSKRKKTLVDELLADAEAKAYQKKKFKSIVDTKRNLKGKKALNHSKKLKKKK